VDVALLVHDGCFGEPGEEQGSNQGMFHALVMLCDSSDQGMFHALVML
jgi:hypothetical protein